VCQAHTRNATVYHFCADQRFALRPYGLATRLARSPEETGGPPVSASFRQFPIVLGACKNIPKFC
jgi:hypothetical protein